MLQQASVEMFEKCGEFTVLNKTPKVTTRVQELFAFCCKVSFQGP